VTNNSHKSLLPTKLKYKVLSSFLLMSLLPILAGLYVTSLFVRFPFNADPVRLTTVTLVCFFSLLLSFLGYRVMKQSVDPFDEMSHAAHDIAEGKLDVTPPLAGDSTDEIQDLSRSLRIITHNAKELLEKVEKLSLKDKLTGLYNAAYIRERLDEEIQRSIHYQRPCAFAYLQVQNYDAYVAARGEAAAEEGLKSLAEVLSTNIRQFDRAARIGRGEFVIIFPDRNKKKAIEIMERVAQQVTTLSFMPGGEEKMVPSVGVSENPIDGMQADGLYVKALDRMKAAKAAGKPVEAFV
jgi:diguanylate cyclase (GGDEF)-like protein